MKGTVNFGSKSGGNAEMRILQRINDLEIRIKQIPSTFNRPKTPTQIVYDFLQTAHGFSVGLVVGRNLSNQWIALHTSDILPGTFIEPIGVVYHVADADNFSICCFGQAKILGATFTVNGTYYIPSSGTAGVPTSSRTGLPPNVRAVFQALSAIDIVVFGWAEQSPRIAELGDTATTGVTDGQILSYTASSNLWTPVSGISSLGPRTALSVFGRSVNSSGTGGDIVSVSDGDVLCRSGTTIVFQKLTTLSLANDAVTTLNILNSNVTNPKLDDIITAGGPIGSSSVVPVITFNSKGRLTSVTSQTITPGAIGAATSGHNHTIDSLTSVVITSKATNDFLKWNGTNWININLGLIQYLPVTSEFALDGGASASTGSVVGLGQTNSRFLLAGLFGGIGVPFDLLLSGSVALTTDISARIRTMSSTQVSFYDQATSSSNGSEVIRWNVSNTATSRSIQFNISSWFKSRSGSNYIGIQNYGANDNKWCIVDDLGPGTYLIFDPTGSNGGGYCMKLGVDLYLVSQSIVFSASSSIYNSGGSVVVSSNNLSCTNNITAGAKITCQTLFSQNGTDGITTSVTLAKLTTLGTTGSITSSGGIITTYTAPT